MVAASRSNHAQVTPSGEPLRGDSTMATQTPGSLVVSLGPSGMVKTSLARAFSRFYPGRAGQIRSRVLCNSRFPCTTEQEGVDYHFRRRELSGIVRAAC